MLDVLKVQWEHYWVSTDTYQVATVNSGYKLDALNPGGGSYDSWIKEAVKKWDGTYSQTVNANIASLTGALGLTRESLLKSWIPIEAGPGTTHWGLIPNNYRMIAGAADRRMSLGFTQIQSRYIYGQDPRTRACTVLDGTNYILPKNNVVGLPIWSANIGCGESFRRAFRFRYDASYSNSGSEKIIHAKYGNNNGVLLVVGSTIIDFTDGDYERLTKGIAGYNQGGTTNSDWGSSSLPGMLKNLTKAANCGYTNKGEEISLKRCKGLSYAIDVKEAAGIPMVNYIWRVVKTNPNPILNENICFEYGETHWKNNLSWKFVKDKALLDQPLIAGGASVKIPCPVSTP